MKRIASAVIIMFTLLAVAMSAVAAGEAGESSRGRRRGVERPPFAEAEGAITAISPTSITVQKQSGPSVTADLVASTIIRQGNTPVPVANLVLGQRVELKAAPGGTGLVAVEILVNSSGNQQGQGNVVGLVTAADATSLTVLTRSGSQTVQTDANTVITKAGATITLTQIVVGDMIEAQGSRVDSTTILATNIHVESPETDNDEVSGTVASVGAGSFVVTTRSASITVTVAPETIITRNGATIALTDIAVGDKIEAKGSFTDATTFAALSVDVESETETEDAEISGVIASIGAGSIVVTTDSGPITVTITDATVIKSGRTALTAADLQVGQQVEVKGTSTDASSMTATSIKVETPEGPEEAEFDGTIASTGAGQIVVNTENGPVTVTITGTTVINRGRTTITAADLAVGDKVEVKGTAVDASNVTATSIKDESESDDDGGSSSSVQLRGNVSAIGSGQITVSTSGGSVTVTVTDSTVIMKRGRRIQLSGLTVGDRVGVSGTQTAPSEVTASMIQVGGGGDD